MTQDAPLISVVVPTLAEAARKEALLRAIDCILNQKGVNALPLVVINGNRFDRELRADLEARDDIQVIYVEEGSLPNAQRIGAEHVQTPFYSFLDDDDLYTPDALAHRLALIEAAPGADIAVTNFLIDKAGQRTPVTDDMMAYADDPRHSIFELAWLHSTNHLFRRSTVGPEHFAQTLKWMEWTWLAIRLSKTGRVAFSNQVTAIYFDTPNSASKRIEHLEAQAILMASLDKSEFAPKTRRLIDRKYVAGLHAVSKAYLERGERGLAWKHHLACFTRPLGWRYLSYTRKLLLPRPRAR